MELVRNLGGNLGVQLLENFGVLGLELGRANAGTIDELKLAFA